MPTRSQAHLLRVGRYTSSGQAPPGLIPPVLPAPTLLVLTPNTASIAAGPFPVNVNGLGFVAGSVVHVDGNAIATTYVGPEDLSVAALNPAAPPRIMMITVRNPNAPSSNPLPFTLTA